MKPAIISTIAILALTGCTIERTVVQEPTTTTEATTTTTEAPVYEIPATASSEDDFISLIIQVYGPLPVSRAEVIATGWMTCDGLDSGVTQAEVEQIILSSADSEDSILFLTSIFGSAVLHLCPQYSWMIEGY